MDFTFSPRMQIRHFPMIFAVFIKTPSFWRDKSTVYQKHRFLDPDWEWGAPRISFGGNQEMMSTAWRNSDSNTERGVEWWIDGHHGNKVNDEN